MLAYLVGRTFLLVLAVWLGLGGEFAQTAKFPLLYVNVLGDVRHVDRSLPSTVWGARIVPRRNTVEGNASVGRVNSCRRNEHAQDLLNFKAMVTSIPSGTQDESPGSQARRACRSFTDELHDSSLHRRSPMSGGWRSLACRV